MEKNPEDSKLCSRIKMFSWSFIIDDDWGFNWEIWLWEISTRKKIFRQKNEKISCWYKYLDFSLKPLQIVNSIHYENPPFIFSITKLSHYHETILNLQDPSQFKRKNFSWEQKLKWYIFRRNWSEFPDQDKLLYFWRKHEFIPFA